MARHGPANNAPYRDPLGQFTETGLLARQPTPPLHGSGHDDGLERRWFGLRLRFIMVPGGDRDQSIKGSQVGIGHELADDGRFS